MQSARKRHDEILRSSIESHDGYVFKTVGDAFCAAFPTAREAVQATLAAQRTLFAEQWPENVTLRARMGLHTDVAEESEGDYFGPPVNRVARLMSTGHGGQVLLSDATHNLGRDDLMHLEPEAELRYLGEHRLKDLRHTERVFQLVVPDLPKDFPPLKTHGLVAELVNLDRRYSRKGFLGGGGFADVYLVRHEALDRDMALKVPKQQYAEDEQFVKRFEREAKNAAKLSHPNIVAVHDAGEGLFEGRKTPYITMEHVSGGTLRDLIRQQDGPLPPSRALELALQVAEALGEAHRRGIIHRDIKPENILLSERGYAKVADFGIARAVSAATVAVSSALIGTPHYISPEQAEGEPASFRSDLYSLGVVLYEMLTGEVPYDAETPWGILSKHVRGQLRPPKAANPNVPERVNAITARLLARDPKERYPDAAALMADLERVKDDPGAVVDDTGPTVPGLERARDDLDPIEDDVGPTTTVRVPDLAGQKLARARGVLAEASLSLGSQSRAPSETVPEGEVVEQEPPTGTEVQPDSSVRVTVSSGPSTVEVPDLTGLNRSEVRSTLAAAGLKLGDQNEVPSDTVTKGGIIKQYPAAGTKAERGSSVSVTVSSGPSIVEVPELAGLNRSEASSMLTTVGLELGIQNEVPSETAPEGEIIGQYPAAQTKAERGSSVSITISSGLREVAVPDLTGQRLPQARSRLAEASLKLGGKSEAPSDEVAEGEIIEQNPVAGTKAKQGSSVRVTVSAVAAEEDPDPEEKSSVPEDVGLERQDRQKRITWKTGVFSFVGAFLAFIAVGQIGLWASGRVDPGIMAWTAVLASFMFAIYALVGLLAAYFAYRAVGWAGIALVSIAVLIVGQSGNAEGLVRWAAVGIILLLVVIYVGNRRGRAARRDRRRRTPV